MSDKILKRVRALLAQAEDPAATPAEAEAFSAKAEELIAKYALDNALLESRGEEKTSPVTRRMDVPEPYGKAKSALLTVIGRSHNVFVARDMSAKQMVLVGFPSDLDLVEMLYTSLLLQGTHAMLRESQSSRSFRTSFWYAFAHQTHVRLERARDNAAKGTGVGTSIVIADRSREVKNAAFDAVGKTRKASQGRATSRAGTESGRAAANRADHGGTRFAGARKALA